MDDLGTSLGERTVICYRGPRGAARTIAAISGPAVLGPDSDGWQPLVALPGSPYPGLALGLTLVRAPGMPEGGTAVALVRDGATRTLVILSPTGQEASVHWSAEVPPATEDDLAEAVAAMQRLSGGDADAIRRAVLRTDSPSAALADLVSLLDLPPLALRMLDAEESDLSSLGEGLLRRDAAAAWTDAHHGPDAPPPSGRADGVVEHRDRALERTERAFGWTWIVLGALITLLGAFAAGAGAQMEGGALLPGNPWLLMVVGVALVVLGLTRRRR